MTREISSHTLRIFMDRKIRIPFTPKIYILSIVERGPKFFVIFGTVTKNDFHLYLHYIKISHNSNYLKE